MRELTANEVDLLVDQLERTSAMLAVLLENIYPVAGEEHKNQITKEIGEINRLLISIRDGTWDTKDIYWGRLEKYNGAKYTGA